MIKINYKKAGSFVLVLFLLVIMPLAVSFAAMGTTPGESSLTIQNPLGRGNTSVEAVLLKVMNLVAMVGGVVVVFFIIYSGFLFVTAGDSDTDRSKAKDVFLYTVIGGAILLGADVIANIVVGTVNAIKQ